MNDAYVNLLESNNKKLRKAIVLIRADMEPGRYCAIGKCEECGIAISSVSWTLCTACQRKLIDDVLAEVGEL